MRPYEPILATKIEIYNRIDMLKLINIILRLTITTTELNTIVLLETNPLIRPAD